MIEVANNHPCIRFPRGDTHRTIYSVLETESASLAALSVVFVGDGYIREINKRFLRHDDVTDVIAFSLEGGLGVDGEVYVNLDRAKKQAKEYGVSFREETRRLLVHGTLHLLGYDDATGRARARMREREDYHLAKLSSKKR
ncbi:MAG TPA: rRNA maturation RNase YbeY [Bacteroidetes bacterium]|nr:rRNA maturation RNase YbeY [Bacteroidota bacterium]